MFQRFGQTCVCASVADENRQEQTGRSGLQLGDQPDLPSAGVLQQSSHRFREARQVRPGKETGTD